MQARDVCKWYNVCPMKRYFEEGKLDIKWDGTINKKLEI